MLAVWLIVFGFPLLSTVQQSFSPILGGEYTTENYKLLFSDPQFWNCIKNSFIFAVVSSIFQLVIGLLFGLIIYPYIKENLGKVFMALFIVPYFIPTIFALFLWRWILHESYGLLNYLLLNISIIENPVVWYEKSTVWFTILLISTWKFTPFSFMVILSGLMKIPTSIFDSLKIDRAGFKDKFILGILPYIRTHIIVVLILRFLFMFSKFDIIWLIAQGGSVGQYIETLPVYVYRKGFEAFDPWIASASAITAIVLVIIIALVALIIANGNNKNDVAKIIQ